jgi:subtilase family serine protease
MGGSMFYGDAAATGSGSTWAATQYWAGTSGSDVISSALSYIPEQPWNDSTYGFSATGSDFGGGGGGASAFFTKPAWQVGVGVLADGSRDVPDLVLDASDAHDPLLYCVNVALGDSCTSGFRISGGDLYVAGGTSFDSQMFGGMLALVEQKIGSKLGNTNPILYALANNGTYYTPGSVSTSSNGLVFNDITSGNNAMPCLTGTTNCANGGTAGFSAGNGYDLASGWGSVNLSNLANAWAWGEAHPLGVGPLGTTPSATTLTASTGSTAFGGTVTLSATVTGLVTTPTGTVQFLVNDVPLGSPVTVTGSGGTATASYSWVTSCSNFGQNSMSASYSGDANYQGSKGPVLTAGGSSTTANGSSATSPVTVVVTGSTCADYSISTPSTVTVAAGGTIPPATVTVTAINGFVGTVTFSVVTTSTTDYSPTFAFTPASVTLTSSTTTASTSLALSGITASLHLPNAPGKFDSGITVAQNSRREVSGARERWYATGSGVTIASLLLLTLPRRRRLGGLLLVALAIALIGGATGCGSSQPGPPTTTTTTTSSGYAGDYYVTIVGTYTNSTTGQIDVHSTTVTYVIN